MEGGILQSGGMQRWESGIELLVMGGIVRGIVRWQPPTLFFSFIEITLFLLSYIFADNRLVLAMRPL